MRLTFFLQCKGDKYEEKVDESDRLVMEACRPSVGFIIFTIASILFVFFKEG